MVHMPKCTCTKYMYISIYIYMYTYEVHVHFHQENGATMATHHKNDVTMATYMYHENDATTAIRQWLTLTSVPLSSRNTISGSFPPMYLMSTSGLTAVKALFCFPSQEG